MKKTTMARLCGSASSVLILVLLLLLTAHAQTAPPKPDPETDRVQAMVSQAKKEAEQFSKSGGKDTDAKHPNLKWAATLWQYHVEHPGTPATVVATAESLTLLNRSDRIDEMQAKADTLKLDDPAWQRVIYILLSAASKTKDYGYVIAKADALAQGAVDPEIKALARFTVGNAYWRKKDIEQARTAFRTVVTDYPKSSYAEDAEGNLREIEFLNPGQPAPSFERSTINGEPISMAGFKGKVVVLKFWGTY